MVAAVDALPLAAAIPGPVRDLTALLLAALIAIALLGRSATARWGGVLAALLIAPLLLAGVVLDDDRAQQLLDHPALLAGGLLGGGALLGALVLLLVRRPALLPVLAAVAIPIRVPIELGDESVKLLLPLYALIGAGALAAAIRARRRARALARAWDLRSEPAQAAVLEERRTQRPLTGAAAWVPPLLAATVAWYALRIPFSEDADQGVETLCFFLVPFAALFVVLRDIDFTPRLLRQVAWALVALALIAVALGDYEFQTGRVLWTQNVLDASSLNQAVRVNSLFFDPNVYGRFLMIVLLGVVTALAWGARGRAAVALAALLVVLWTGLLVTFSQSSMAGLLVGALLLLALRFGVRRALAAGGALVVLALVAVFALSDVLRIDVADRDGLWNTTSGRSALIEGGVDLFEQRPVLGWGSGSYREAYRSQRDVSGVRAVAASHTTPVTVAAEQGVPGLLLYVALLGAAVAALLRRARATPPRAAIAAAFVALVVHTWLYAAFLEDPFTWALLAVGLTLGAADEPLDPIAASAAPAPGDAGGAAVADPAGASA